MHDDARSCAASRWFFVAKVVLGCIAVLPVRAEDSPLPGPSWSAAAGQDQYGRWADLTVQGATQRMRWIPPGTFTMGSPQAERDLMLESGLLKVPEAVATEIPHRVTIRVGYWLADSECTQGFWRAVMGSNPSWFREDPCRPVDSVSWDDVQPFLAKVTTLISGARCGLPTEAQWEYACRTGTTTAVYAGDFTVIPGSRRVQELDGIAWYGANSDVGWQHPGRPRRISGMKDKGTWPVKLKQPNAWGLYDMIGNVDEWCVDWYGPYAGDASEPTGPESGTRRVFRGGGYCTGAPLCRAAERAAIEPNTRGSMWGFRFAIVEDPK